MALVTGAQTIIRDRSEIRLIKIAIYPSYTICPLAVRSLKHLKHFRNSGFFQFLWKNATFEIYVLSGPQSPKMESNSLFSSKIKAMPKVALDTKPRQAEEASAHTFALTLYANRDHVVFGVSMTL
ncbi:hypothetical protein ACTXT7_004813 [Hymenolepis weldensis]